MAVAIMDTEMDSRDESLHAVYIESRHKWKGRVGRKGLTMDWRKM